MNSKKATYVLLTGLLVLAVIYLISAVALGKGSIEDYNKSNYPIILGSLLILFIIIDAFQSLKEKKYKIELGNFLQILATLVVIIVYFFLWTTIGYFYLLTFIVLLSLQMIYKNQYKNWKTWLVNGVVSITVTLSIYYIFGTLLNINFS